jgi:hypothetical protein
MIKKEDFGEMEKSKLFNYLLQNLETSLNILILWDVIKILYKKNTKLILYTYDSILLDVDNTESDLIKEIKAIFKKYKLNIKEKKGHNYDFK